MAVVLTRRQGIDTFPKTFISLLDTPTTYAGSANEYLRSTGSALEFTAISGAGTTDHSALSNLDYENSSHTGFASTVHIHDDRYYTESEIDTISGSLSAEIDADIITFSGTINHNTILNTHNLITDIDHNQLTNYSVDEHRTIDDFGAGAVDLWSAQKISSEITTISGKLDEHNELKNIQGGTIDEYYHLTNAQHTDLTGGKDNYQSWSFAVDGVTKDAITSGDILDFVGGDNITITRSADDRITISGTPGGGSPNHDELNNLDYVNSGHAGFASTADLATTSGSLQPQIDGKSDIGHTHNGVDGWLIKSTNYTASVSDKIMLDSLGGSFIVTLLANPSLGDLVGFLDLGSCGTNNVTVSGGGSKIMGLDEPLIIDTDNAAFDLIYSNSTYGWRIK